MRASEGTAEPNLAKCMKGVSEELFLKLRASLGSPSKSRRRKSHLLLAYYVQKAPLWAHFIPMTNLPKRKAALLSHFADELSKYQKCERIHM